MPRRLHKLTDFLVAAARRLFDARRVREAKRNAPSRPLAKRPARCWFERLESREVFSATFHGGALIPHVEAQAVFLGSQWNSNATLEIEADSINKYLGGLVQSPYMDMLTDAGYNVGQGTYTPGKVINTTITGTVTDATIRSLLQAAINFEIDGKPAGLVEQPDANRLYIVYTPSGVTVNDNGATSQTSFLGYHGAFAGSDVYGVPFDIHYVVVPHPGTPNPVSTTNGFIGAADVQTLTLGGTGDGTLTPSYNGIFATVPIIRANESQKLTLTTPVDSFTLGFNSVPAPIAISLNDYQLLTVGGTTGQVALSYKGVSATSAFTPINEVQQLTIGGAASSTFKLSFNGVAGSDATKLTVQAGASPTAAQVLDHLNSISALNGNVAVSGSDGGPFTITFNNSLAGTNVSQITSTDVANTVTTITDGSGSFGSLTAAQVQANLNTIPALAGKVTVTGNPGGPFTIRFDGSLKGSASLITAAATGGASATIISFVPADEVKSSLESIPALAGNVQVTGANNGPFTITFVGALSDTDVGTLTKVAVTTTGGGDVTIAQVTNPVTGTQQGTPVTATSGTNSVLSSLNSIPALNGNVSVTGLNGGPFTISIKNLGNASTIDVSGTTGGLTAIITTSADGVAGSTSDVDQLTAVTSHELAEAVTDPNVNYKTLGWYDAVNNVEIADLPNATADIPNITVRLNGFLTQKVYDQSVNRIAPDTTSTPFPSNNAKLQNVTAQQISLTRALVSWTPVPGASGYRVLQVSNGQTTLLGRVPSMQNGNPTSSTVLTGLQQAGSLTLRVEAYNAANITAPAEVPLTMTLAGLTLPTNVVANKIPNSSTSVLLTWTGSVGAAGYRVFQVNGTTKSLRATLGESVTSATINGLKAGTKVSFIVEAFRGSAKADSIKASVQLNSLTFTVTRKVPAPGPTTVELDWSWNTSNPGATSYRVYRVTSSGSRVLVATRSSSATSVLVSGFPASTKFIVQAMSGSAVLKTSGPV